MTHALLVGLRAALICFATICAAAGAVIAFGFILNTIAEMGGG